MKIDDLRIPYLAWLTTHLVRIIIVTPPCEGSPLAHCSPEVDGQ